MVEAQTAREPTVVFRTRYPLASTHLLIGGLLLIPGFILQESLVLRYFQVLFYMLLAARCGKRVLITPNLIMLAGVVAANLLSPLGAVLFTLGPLPVTLGALRDGLYKASLLIGLIYISRIAVRDDLVLPGRFGSLIGRVFYYFGLITERRNEGKRTGEARWTLKSAGDLLVARVDALLDRLENNRPASEGGEKAGEAVVSTPPGIALICALVAANAALLLLSRFLP